MARIGLVAGYGTIPIIFAQKAKEKGDTVIALGLKGVTSEELARYVDKMHWFEWGQFHKALMLVVTERIRKIVMLGKIRKDLLFKDEGDLDDEIKTIINKTRDRKDYAILKRVADTLAKFGIEIMDSTTYLEHLIPEKGVLTKRAPTREESEDIEYGRTIARELARLDIGQTLAVNNKTVIAIEGAEGTDEAIKRAGSLSAIGFVVVKVARPEQDMRFDVPLIGLDTVKVLAEAGGKALALEGGKTLLVDKEEVIKLADGKGIAIIII